MIEMMLADLHGLMCEFLLVEDDIRELMSWLCQMSSNGMVFMASLLKPLFINHFAFTWMLGYVAFLVNLILVHFILLILIYLVLYCLLIASSR